MAPLSIPTFSDCTTASNIANVALQLSIDGFTVDAVFDAAIFRFFEGSTLCDVMVRDMQYKASDGASHSIEVHAVHFVIMIGRYCLSCKTHRLLLRRIRVKLKLSRIHPCLQGQQLASCVARCGVVMRTYICA